MGRYEKYQIVEIPPTIVKIGKSDYPRPFLVIDVTATAMYLMCLSTKVDTYFNENRDFLIEKDEDGFATTGLADTCFVRNQEFSIAPYMELKVLGYLSGDLLERFESFAKRFDL